MARSNCNVGTPWGMGRSRSLQPTLTANGLLDLAVVNRESNTISVRLGNGDGRFQPQHRCDVGERPECVTAADLNGDGAPDLIVVNPFGRDFSILFGNGDGTFQAQQRAVFVEAPWSVVAADFKRATTSPILR